MNFAPVVVSLRCRHNITFLITYDELSRSDLVSCHLERVLHRVPFLVFGDPICLEDVLVNTIPDLAKRPRADVRSEIDPGCVKSIWISND